VSDDEERHGSAVRGDGTLQGRDRSRHSLAAGKPGTEEVRSLSDRGELTAGEPDQPVEPEERQAGRTDAGAVGTHGSGLAAADPASQRSWRSTSRDDRPDTCRRSSRICGNGIGASTCGRANIFARWWARWTKRRSKPILKTKSGMKMKRVSRTQRPPGFELALSRSELQAASSRILDFQSHSILPALSR
jgi:hypothetical protein